MYYSQHLSKMTHIFFLLTFHHIPTTIHNTAVKLELNREIQPLPGRLTVNYLLSLLMFLSISCVEAHCINDSKGLCGLLFKLLSSQILGSSTSAPLLLWVWTKQNIRSVREYKRCHGKHNSIHLLIRLSIYSADIKCFVFTIFHQVDPSSNAFHARQIYALFLDSRTKDKHESKSMMLLNFEHLPYTNAKFYTHFKFSSNSYFSSYVQFANWFKYVTSCSR